MSKRLIVNADDYGRAPGVSRGILRAHREGIVTSTTVMVNQPGARAQLEDALACSGDAVGSAARLGVGLHLVFSAWRPVLPPEMVPGLVDESGSFLDQHTLWACAQDIPLKSLQAELTAQVERFATWAGGLPDHLDCHHFVYLYPPFFQVYADLADQFHLPLRVPFPPEPDFRWAVRTLPFLEGFPHDLVRGMVATNTNLLKARGLAHPDHFIATFYGREALTLQFLLHLLDTLPEGTSELMCHPGYDDPALAPSTYRAEREIELALLTHPLVRQRVADLQIELVTFRALLDQTAHRASRQPPSQAEPHYKPRATDHE
jgi:predicted glycoside hydrolase/deacetylase ChbG (UPF0249 family)